MPVKTFFTPHSRLLLSSLGATLISSLTAFNTYPESFTGAYTCDRHTLSEWRLQLADRDPLTEAPQLLAATESFLRACPTRPEVSTAQVLAGILAVRTGEAERARYYLEASQARFQLNAGFAYMASLLALGDEQRAWAARDEIIDRWLSRLVKGGKVRLSLQVETKGRLLEIEVKSPDRPSGVEFVWVALPDKGGWPASISAGQAASDVSIRLISREAQSKSLSHIDQYQCRKRRLISQPEGGLSRAEFAVSARSVLTAYLDDPDTFQPTPPGMPLYNCYWPERLLPELY